MAPPTWRSTQHDRSVAGCKTGQRRCLCRTSPGIIRAHTEPDMAHGMYEVLALLPETSDFTLEEAVAFFRTRRYGEGTLRAELALSERTQQPSGFRVWYGDWAVVAWLETGRGVLGE